MSFLEWGFYGNPLHSWGVALLVVAGALALLAFLKFVLLTRLAGVAARSPNRLDDALIEAVRATRRLFLLAVSLYLGAGYLELSGQVEATIRRVFIVIALIQAGIWVSTLIDFMVRHYSTVKLATDGDSTTMIRFLGLIGRLVVWFLMLLMALENLGVDITALVAGLGVGGIAVALAVQNILGDLLASLSIVFDKPFVIGDFIVVDDTMGTVENIGIKTTRLRSLSGEQLIFSNGDLLSSRIRNFKRMAERRVIFGVGVTYDTPYDKVQSVTTILRTAVEAQEKIRFERAHFKGFGPSSLDFEVAYYVLEPDYNLHLDIQHAINLHVLKTFAEQEIAFAFPTQTVYVEKLGRNDRCEGEAPASGGGLLAAGAGPGAGRGR